jgi:hypothetical protein
MIQPRVRASLALLLCSVAAWLNSVAAPQPCDAAEIEYLLDAVGTSSCEFYRNGSWYGPALAAAHLREKRDVLAARGGVATAEEFITNVATHSATTGTPYRVRCAGGTTLSLVEWLSGALASRRHSGAPSHSVPNGQENPLIPVK